MVNVKVKKVCWLSRNYFWKNIGCLVSDTIFGIWGSRLLDKEEAQNIRGKGKKEKLN